MEDTIGLITLIHDKMFFCSTEMFVSTVALEHEAICIFFKDKYQSFQVYLQDENRSKCLRQGQWSIVDFISHLPKFSNKKLASLPDQSRGNIRYHFLKNPSSFLLDFAGGSGVQLTRACSNRHF